MRAVNEIQNPISIGTNSDSFSGGDIITKLIVLGKEGYVIIMAIFGENTEILNSWQSMSNIVFNAGNLRIDVALVQGALQ